MSFFERDYLKERFQSLLQEKRELRQLYREESDRIDKEFYIIKNRIAELDRESRDYLKNNIDYEGTMVKLTSVVENLSKLIPSVPVDAVINKFNSDFPKVQNENNNIEESEIREKPKTIQSELLDKKEKPALNNHAKIGVNYTDLKIVGEKVILILKENGSPMKSNQIQKILKDQFNWKWNNFSNTMNDIMRTNNKIQRATRGYYQYVGY